MNNYIDLGLLLWVIFALSTAMIAYSRGRSFFKWLLIGLIFGFLGLLYAFLFLKRKQIKYTVPHKDTAERKLWYYNLKQEFEKSKHETDISGESKI